MLTALLVRHQVAPTSGKFGLSKPNPDPGALTLALKGHSSIKVANFRRPRDPPSTSVGSYPQIFDRPLHKNKELIKRYYFERVNPHF